MAGVAARLGQVSYGQVHPFQSHLSLSYLGASRTASFNRRCFANNKPRSRKKKHTIQVIEI